MSRNFYTLPPCEAEPDHVSNITSKLPSLSLWSRTPTARTSAKSVHVFMVFAHLRVCADWDSKYLVSIQIGVNVCLRRCVFSEEDGGFLWVTWSTISIKDQETVFVRVSEFHTDRPAWEKHVQRSSVEFQLSLRQPQMSPWIYVVYSSNHGASWISIYTLVWISALLSIAHFIGHDILTSLTLIKNESISACQH